MNRKVWKWILGISITVLVLIYALMLYLWAAGHVLMAMFVAAMGEGINSQSFWEFYETFPGSPLFYVALLAAVGLITSVVVLICTRKKKNCRQSPVS